MSRDARKAMDMVERNIAAIGASAYPSAEYVLGVVEAMYRMGHISDDQHANYTQAAFDAVMARRQALLRDAAEQRMKQVLERRAA